MTFRKPIFAVNGLALLLGIIIILIWGFGTCVCSVPW